LDKGRDTRTVVVRLKDPAGEPERATFLDELRESFSAGVRHFVVDLTQLKLLDSPAVAVLIEALRAVRADGGSIVLAATAPSVRRTLALTALDRIFDVQETVPPSAVPALRPPGPRSALQPGTAAGLVALALLALPWAAGAQQISPSAPASVQASPGAIHGGDARRDPSLQASPGAIHGGDARRDPSLQPEAIIARVAERNPNLRSFESSVRLDVRMRSFPFLGQHVSGTSYFKKPNNYEVVFRKMPGYAKSFARVASDVADPTTWAARFTITADGERDYNGRRDLVLRLVQRVRGMIDHEIVLVDPAAWQIDRMEWHYYNGGEIAMDQEYQGIGEFVVLARQRASIHIPYVRAVATANYGDYRTNVAIDDSVFAKSRP
jgi:anti-anti-sigma factor